MADKKKILLVDDDPDFVEAVRVIVESGGYEVRVAYDGQEGLDAVAEEKPDLIVLDVMMPWPIGSPPVPIPIGTCWKVRRKTICQNRLSRLNCLRLLKAG
jgi:CheY-like chemotaxis protein